MDESELIKNFEETIKKNSMKQPLTLYKNKNINHLHITNTISANSIIANVTTQLKAIQKADVSCYSKSRKKLENYKKSSFQSVNTLSRDVQVSTTFQPKSIAKFETQFDMDTQLVDLIDNAEALIDHNNGITQEFNSTFNNLEEGKSKSCTETGPKNGNTLEEEDLVSKSSDNIKMETSKITILLCNENIDSKNTAKVSEDCTCLLKDGIEIESDVNKLNNFTEDNDTPPSFVFDSKKSNITSPLVFDLNKFEDFEKIALPIIEQTDLKSAKHLINSQIMGKEFTFQKNCEPQLSEMNNELSPVLKINQAKSEDSKSDREDNMQCCKSNTFLSDEILFSSDEENEDVCKEFQDLPLTCALETSFYDHSEVLDKTMYVGFQTASNRSIQISTESMTKAKSLLDNLDKSNSTKISLTELVDKCDSLSKNRKPSLVHSKNPNLISRRDILNLSDQETKLKLKENEDININSIDFNIILPNHEDVETKNNENFDVETKYTNSSKPNEQLKENIKLQANTNKEFVFIVPVAPVKRKFDGFMTASNKIIKLSEQGIERCKKLFQDIYLDEKFEADKETDDVNEKISIINERSNISALDSQHIDEDILNEFAQDMSQAEDKIKKETEKFVGFETASKKHIHVSEEAIARTKKIFEDICPKEDLLDNDQGQNKNTLHKNIEISNFVGFKTASNKSIKISEEALAKSKTILEDLDGFKIDNLKHTVENNEALDLVLPFSSKTASRGTITYCKKEVDVSGKKMKHIYQDVVPDTKIDTNETCFKTDKNNCNENLPEVAAFVGFKTANNKEIKISEEAYKKTKNMFKNITAEENDAATIEDDIHDSNKHIDEIKNIETALEIEEINKFRSEIHDEDFNTEFDIVPVKEQESIKSVLCGFKTASNKSVKISDNALAESKKLFADLDLSDDFNNEMFKSHVKNVANNKITGGVLAETCEIVVPGHKIPNKEEVNVSENNVNKNFSSDLSDVNEIKPKIITQTKTTNINADYLNPNNKEKDIPTFALFQTASQKPVEISDEALAKSRNLFKSINIAEGNMDKYDENDKELVPFKGFQTANMKPIAISMEALVKSKALFKELDNVDDNMDANILNYKISQEITNSLAHTTNNKPMFKGFQTASRKPVHISEAALAKSKSLFKDIDDGENVLERSRFKGYQIASNETVTASTKALVRNKKIFEDIDDSDRNKGGPHTELNKFAGFQTGNNKKVKISEEALKRSRQVFQDVDLGDSIDKAKFGTEIDKKNKENCNTNIQKSTICFKTVNHNDKAVLKNDLDRSKNINSNANSDINKKDTQEVSLDKLIDTQVMKNLDITLHTEDFFKDTTPKQHQRSGSPILSCPKAKRRKKFETPFRSGPKSICDVSKSSKIEIDDNNDITLFTENYKKAKRYTLLDLAEAEKSECKRNLDDFITKFSYDTILEIEFSGKRNELTNACMTVEDIEKSFLSVVNKNLVPKGWFNNHIRLIIWKLISYEVKFPSTLAGVCSVRNILDQLKYRYDKELYNAERPILRKILEKDDVPARSIVLCVAAIYVDGASVSGATNITSNVELLLTDGWYCVKATIDKMLTKLVYDEKIKIGCKIITNGAELVNCDQGVAPWEDTSSVRLKIFGNSTRLARWHTRLGCHNNGAILTQLSSVQPEGGKISKLRFYITRVYPALYIEKFEDGSTVTRSERLEHIHQAKFESERQVALEKLYEEVERELSDQESQDSEGGVASKKIFEDGSQFIIGSHITNSQIKSIEERSNRRRERMIQKIQTKLQEKMEKRGLHVKRNVVPLLKMRVAGVVEKNGSVEVTKGLLSIWKPNEAIIELIKEGIWLEGLNVVPTAVRYSEIHISAGRHSLFLQSKYKPSDKVLPFTKLLNRKCYHIKDLIRNPLAYTDYNEIDTVGFIFHVEPSNLNFELSKQPFQNVYFADEDKNIICVNFWGGLKKFGYHNVLDTGQVFACVNLQKRTGNTKKNIPHYRVTEFSYFTKTPQDVTAKNNLDELSKIMSGFDKTKFCNECLIMKSNFSRIYKGDNISPYRFNNDHDLSKNKFFIDSPAQQKPTDDLNLTGLDFESSFKQENQLSPNMLLRKKKVNEKIAKLKMYGEPPPLSPMHIINKSKNALKEFKSPLASKNSVASAKNSPGKSGNDMDKNIQSSPIMCLNRTYVKSINPTKLDFNVQDNSADNVDHFAEEFDASPPLSLD